MPKTHYLNTDLDIVSREDPNPLVAALTLREFWLLHAFQRKDGLWFANFESHQQHDQPEPDILVMLTAIEGLGGAARAFWNACVSKEFNIGYEGGEEPKALEHQLAVETLSRMAALGISQRITLYPPAPEHPVS